MEITRASVQNMLHLKEMNITKITKLNEVNLQNNVKVNIYTYI